MSKKNRNWEWDGDKLKYAVLPEAPKAVPAKKDKRRWCRGKVGVEHVLETRLSKHGIMLRDRFPEKPNCEWYPMYRWIPGTEPRERMIDRWVWSCRHEEGCANCGKILVVFMNKRCPNFYERETE